MSRTLRGFTLVELLIALAIFGLLSTLGYRAIAALTDSEARLAQEAQRWRALDQLFARLEADLRAATPRPMRAGDAVLPPWQGGVDASGNAELVLARAGSEFVIGAGSAGQRIGYAVNGNALEILYWPYLDQPATTAPARYVLADGIAGFALRYLDTQGRWQDRWPVFGEPALPRAVRADVALAEGGTLERWLVLQ